MTGSMYAAIAGLKTHMQNLNVIGNNIANVNTQGYKSARAVFKTSIYTTLSGGSNGTTVAGGRNPSQIGYGANVASVGVDMSTGNYTVTGNSTDLMLDGAGFFMVGDKSVANNFVGDASDANTLKSLDLTRVGDLDFKADGYLCNGDGRPVYGFLVVGTWGERGTQYETITEGHEAGDPVFSNQLVPIRKPYVYPSTGAADGADGAADGGEGGATTIEIGWPSANVQGVPEGTGGPNGGHLLDYGSYVNDSGEIIESSYERATLTGITIDEKTGIITATLQDRGNQIITIGCIAIGTVSNPNGVTNIGNNYYKAGEGSGELRVCLGNGAAEKIGISHINQELASAGEDAGNPGADDAGEAPSDKLRIRNTDTKMLSNGLENSKTDLAQEIANMIVTQRGYQANTRIITVTDSMLEELVNMKR